MRTIILVSNGALRIKCGIVARAVTGTGVRVYYKPALSRSYRSILTTVRYGVLEIGVWRSARLHF